jgi:hypothetical protein
LKDKGHEKHTQTNNAEKQIKEKKNEWSLDLACSETFRYLINVTRPMVAKTTLPNTIYGYQLLFVSPI